MATTSKPFTAPASQPARPAPLARHDPPAARPLSTRFFTNQADQTLLRKFRGVFESNADIERFDALVGYLRASGYFAIRHFLGNFPHVRICRGQMKGPDTHIRDNQSQFWFVPNVGGRRRAATSIKRPSARTAAKMRAS